MATFKISKVLSALPATLVADTVYLVRAGQGMDIYASDNSGLIAYKTNIQLGTVITVVTISVGGVATCDLSLGDYFTISATSNFTLEFINPPSSGLGRTVDVTVTQDGTGGRTAAMPASFKPIGNTDTTIQSAANAKTKIIVTTIDGGTTYAYTMAKVG